MSDPRQSWHPMKIEKFYKDYPDKLLLWNVLEITEEKRVPFYADEPIGRSRHPIGMINRNNFRPEENMDQLFTVARVLKMDSLPLDPKEAFEKVVKRARHPQQGVLDEKAYL